MWFGTASVALEAYVSPPSVVQATSRVDAPRLGNWTLTPGSCICAPRLIRRRHLATRPRVDPEGVRSPRASIIPTKRLIHAGRFSPAPSATADGGAPPRFSLKVITF